MKKNSKVAKVPVTAKPKAAVKEQTVTKARSIGVASAYTGKRPSPYWRSLAPSRKGSSVRLEGCDYVGSFAIPAGAGAQDNDLPVGAQDSTTFPRLSAIAAVFEEYAFNKCDFVMVGIAPSTFPGAMTGAPDYGDQGSGLTAAQIRNREGQETIKFWETCTVRMDPGKATRPWFSPTDTSPSSDSYLGHFHLYTDAGTANTPVCDLFVCYDVEFAQGVASGDPDLFSIWDHCRRIVGFSVDSKRRMQEIVRGEIAAAAAREGLHPIAPPWWKVRSDSVGVTEEGTEKVILTRLDRQAGQIVGHVDCQDNASSLPRAVAVTELPLRRDSAALNIEVRRDLQCGTGAVHPTDCWCSVCRVTVSSRDVPGKV